MCPVGAPTNHSSNNSWESGQLSHYLLLFLTSQPARSRWGATSLPHRIVLLMCTWDLGRMLRVGRGPTGAPGQGLP